MIEQAINRILELSGIQTLKVDDEIYCKGGQNIVRLKKPEQLAPKQLQFGTLTGLVDYVLQNPDGLNVDQLFFHVVNSTVVELDGPLQPENSNARFVYAAAIADGCQFSFGHWMQSEDMIVALQTCFYRSGEADNDVSDIVDLISNIASERIQTNKDDSFSQTVEVRTGLTTKSKAKVENPVRVRPFRTFPEIEQPETPAVLRFREHNSGLPMVALFQSASKKWESDAMQLIRDWLKDKLPAINILA